MIAQVVFDLPLEGPFDYLVPETLVPRMTAGVRVKVSFGPKTQIGFVTGLLSKSDISQLKSIQSLCDSTAIFNGLDLTFAAQFSAYYGCSLGESLGTILRNRTDQKPSVYRDHKPAITVYRSHPRDYADKVQEIIGGYPHHSRFLVLVPDIFRCQALTQRFKDVGSVRIGTRSSVFESDGQHGCVIMIDEEDDSFKQEQMPMYETRQVLMMRSKMYGFDMAFVGISPSVELMSLVHDGPPVKLIEGTAADVPSARLIDLSNYKYVPGLISVPVRDALDAALKAGQKSILVLNRRGAYRLTRCVDCAHVLKCNHCDSPLIYSRSEAKFLCRHCTFTAPGDTVCPQCHKPSWRSQGIGVEQVQTELKKLFPQARVLAFERDPKKEGTLGDFDILISTSAVLRFQGIWRA